MDQVSEKSSDTRLRARRKPVFWKVGKGRKPFKSEVEKSDNKKESPEIRRIQANEAVGTLGFGIVLGWLLLCYFSDSLSINTISAQGLDNQLSRLIGLIVFGLVFASFMLKADYLARLNLRIYIYLSIGLGVILPLCIIVADLGVFVPNAVVYLAWALNGVASAFALLIWKDYYSRLAKTIIVFSIATTCFIAGLWYFLITLFPVMIEHIAIALSLPLSSLCLFIFVGEVAPDEYISREDSTAKVSLDVRTSFSLTLVGLTSGYLLYKILFDQPGEAVVIVTFAFFLNTVFTFFVSRVFGQYALLLAAVFRYGFPMVVTGFILLPFLNGIPLMIVEVVLLSALTEHWVACFVNISYVVQKYRIQSCYPWIRVNTMFVAGSALGWGVGVIASTLADQSFYDLSFITLILSLGFVIICSFSVAIMPYGIDHLTVKRNYESDSQNENFSENKRIWWEACQSVALQANLTSRETEVFHLLAKGRNTKWIEQELSISTHTVKTHNYNIYRKVGVVSQQKLIDAVENARKELQ